jgi:hypothetical protein
MLTGFIEYTSWRLNGAQAFTYQLLFCVLFVSLVTKTQKPRDRAFVFFCGGK